MATGVGGQPGTATSTGITLATRPQLAGSRQKCHRCSRNRLRLTTSFGSGAASKVLLSAFSMWRDTGPVTSSMSENDGGWLKRMPSPSRL
jgi:hypothetical protein